MRSSLIGQITAVTDVQIDRSQLRLFAKVVGLKEAVYTDVHAARAKGYPDLLVPLTFIIGLETETYDVFHTLEKLGIDKGRVVLGQQEFDFREEVFAGDTIRLSTRLIDITEKKEGALNLLVRETEITRSGTVVQVIKQTLVVRNDLQFVV